MAVCENLTLAPRAVVYFQKIDDATLCLIVAVIFITIASIIVYFFHVNAILVYVSEENRKNHMIWLAGIIPFTVFCCCIGVCVPRAMSVVDAFILLYFARALFTFVHFIVNLFGDHKKMSKELLLKNEPIVMSTAPCCCCCRCLPRLSPSVRNLRAVEFLVLQTAIVRLSLLFIILIIRRDTGTDLNNRPNEGESIIVLSVINGISSLLSIYGCQVFNHLAGRVLPQYPIKKVFISIQLVIILQNLEGPLFDLLANTGAITCISYMPAETRAKIWYHMLIILQLFLLQLGATWLLRPATNTLFDLHPNHAVHSKSNDDASPPGIMNRDGVQFKSIRDSVVI